jgi:uncharacterized protein
MDKLLNEFTVNRPIDEAWKVLTDLERIAPCMPGAELQEIAGDIYRGVVKIKLGAISTAFKGQATFLERDDAGHKAVLKGEGRDTGGKGNADALITAQLQSVSDGVTKCVVETDLRITGKVAQFGRGIMGDVSKKLMTQFANNLNTMLEDDTGGAQAAAAPAAEVAPASEDAPAADAAPAAEPTVRKIQGPAAEAIDIGDVAGGAVVKRLLPALGGLVILLLILKRLRRS